MTDDDKNHPHYLKIGDKAKISLGNNKTAVFTVAKIGEHGITAHDAEGSPFKFLWANVLGPAHGKIDSGKSIIKEREASLTKALLAKKEAPHRALYAGDSVYFSDTTGQAQHGLVAAVGRHGAQVDVQDETGKTTSHNVRHSAIVGHRKRAERKLIVIDRGEDGSIATDEQGKRVFLRGQLPEDDAKDVASGDTLTKSLTQPDDDRITAAINAALAPVLSTIAALQQQHHIELNRYAELVATAINKPLSDIHVRMPEQPAPNIHVDVNVPDQAAPIVHIAPANVTFNAPNEQKISIVSMPTRQTEAVVERDRDGNIKRSTNIEKDAP